MRAAGWLWRVREGLIESAAAQAQRVAALQTQKAFKASGNARQVIHGCAAHRSVQCSFAIGHK